MDAQRLKQYISLQREIKQLERQISKLRAAKARPGRMVADSVQASSPDWPYTEHTLRIRGWLPGEYVSQDEIETLEAQLRESKRRCQRELWGISRYIESRPDSEERQLLRMRYVEGLSLKEIGEEMHVDLSVVGKKLKKITS
jgi:DNA-directed RNA polymerase specialized sigma24 family protein